MKHLLFIASLLAAILLALPLPVRSQKAPIPTKIIEAKTVFLLSETGDERHLDAAYKALRRWGRWEIVGDREKADLVLLLTVVEKAGPSVTSGNVASFPGRTHCNQFPGTTMSSCTTYPGGTIDTRRTIPTTTSEYYIHVLDASSGNPLWMVAGTAQDLVDSLRKRFREQSSFSPKPTSERLPTPSHQTSEPGNRLYIDGYDKAFPGNRWVADCLMDKLEESGAFTFQNSRESAEAILTLDVNIPGGSSRILWGKAPSVRLVVTGPDGSLLWKGENEYKKATTVWGAATDIPCGLANGIADKFVKAMQGVPFRKAVSQMPSSASSVNVAAQAKEPATPAAAPKPANESPSAPTVQQQVEPSAVTFKSSPEGADITVDGKFIGSTPSTVQLAPGDHEVTIQKRESVVSRIAGGEVTVPIYKIWKRTLTVNPGGAITVDATLEKVQ